MNRRDQWAILHGLLAIRAQMAMLATTAPGNNDSTIIGATYLVERECERLIEMVDGADDTVNKPADEPADTAAALAAVKRLRAQLNRSFAVVSSARDSLERFISTDDEAVQIEPGDLELTSTLLDMAGEELANVEHVRELERQLGGAK